MSSPLSDALEAMVNKEFEEREKKIKNRMEVAMDNTEARTKDKIQEIIDEDAVAAYYGGYSPIMYVRIGQLGNSIKPVILSVRGGGTIGFDFGASFDVGAMDHSVLTIRNRKGKTYTYSGHNADEGKILENFRAGEHPNTGVHQGAIWQDGMIGSAAEELKTWVKAGNIRKIFREEIQKLIK